MTSLELQLATSAARELGRHGVVELHYVTAEFEPFSSAQRPDLVFWPDSGPNEGRTFVVELRMPVDPNRKLPTVDDLRQHRDFVLSDTSDHPYFAIATGGNIAKEAIAALSADGIEVFDGIQSGEDLASSILAWSHLQPVVLQS